jgi:hypothetical protein
LAVSDVFAQVILRKIRFGCNLKLKTRRNTPSAIDALRIVCG